MTVGHRSEIQGLVIRQFGLDTRALLKENNPFPYPHGLALRRAVR